MDSVQEKSSFMFHDRSSDSVIQYLDCIYRCKTSILTVVCVHLGVVRINTFQFKRQIDTYSYNHMYFLAGILLVSFLFRVTLSLQTSTRLLQSGFLKQDITTMRSVATASLDTSASTI
jgi:hypothetical protein